MNFGGILWLKFLPCIHCVFFYDFTCYPGGDSGSSFLCIMTSLASSGIIFYATEVMVYATADYACWNGSECALVCISSEEESILYSVWCIRRRCIFLWHDCRGCQSLFYMAQGNRNTMVSAFLFWSFYCIFHLAWIRWVFSEFWLREGPASLYSESLKIDCVYCWTWQWGDDEHSCT